MDLNHLLPFVSTIITFCFAAAVLNRYRLGRKPHSLMWGIGLALYGIGTLAEAYLALQLEQHAAAAVVSVRRDADRRLAGTGHHLPADPQAGGGECDRGRAGAGFAGGGLGGLHRAGEWRAAFTPACRSRPSTKTCWAAPG